jgi:hypothetical protein
MASVIRPWVSDLGNRHQVALLTAMRGCDSIQRDNTARPIVRALRFAVMDMGEETPLAIANNFLFPSLAWSDITAFLKDWDRYPVHFLHHLMHACEVAAYKHPDRDLAGAFMSVYRGLILNLHVTAETEAEMDARLNDQRHADARMAEARPSAVLSGPV